MALSPQIPETRTIPIHVRTFPSACVSKLGRKTTELKNLLTYRLDQNYPNPFNPNTTISYQIPFASDVSLKIYDVSGRLIRTLVEKYESEGVHAVFWDGKDHSGMAVASGIYFYKLHAGEFVETKRMVLLR